MRGVIGVDVGRRVHVAVAPGAPVLRFSADLRGFEALGVYGDALGGGWRVGLEPTGTYAEPLIAWLLARGVEVYAVSPQQARRGRGLFGRETRKSDDQDAAVIAALVAAGVGRRVEPWVGAFRELRVLATQRERQVQVRDRATRRLDAWAARFCPS